VFDDSSNIFDDNICGQFSWRTTRRSSIVGKGILTAQEVRKLMKVDGLHRVATGLYLRVRKGSNVV